MGKINNIEMLEINQLKRYENNSKLHPEKQLKLLAESIKEFGFISPCLIDNDNNIIAGHGRAQAAQIIGMDKIPCVRVEGLTEDQKKAYVIADNRLTELGGWNKDLVAAELSLLDINNFNVDVTGFKIDDIKELNLSFDLPYGAERSRTAKAYNMDISEDIENTNDYWQMPVIKNDCFIPTQLIGFNYAKTSKDKAAGIHFYLDDYQFERIWSYPEKYIDVLKRYECILSPEFSLYWDMPLPMQIWNTYRNRFIGAYYQKQGIKVIPSVVWADVNSFDFCFLGIEKGSIIAVETTGTKSNDLIGRWYAGMDECIKQIEPSTVLVYGGDNGYDFKDINAIYFDNQVLKKWKERSNDT